MELLTEMKIKVGHLKSIKAHGEAITMPLDLNLLHMSTHTTANVPKLNAIHEIMMKDIVWITTNSQMCFLLNLAQLTIYVEVIKMEITLYFLLASNAKQQVVKPFRIKGNGVGLTMIVIVESVELIKSVKLFHLDKHVILILHVTKD